VNEGRLIAFRCIIFGTVVALALALFNAQVVRGRHYKKLSEKNRIRLIRVEAPRGEILDRNGRPLAATRPALDVLIVPEDFDKRQTAALAKILGIRPDDIMQKIRQLQDAPFVPVLLKRDVTKDVAFQIEERKPELTGVFLVVQGLRSYPLGNISSHVLGYLGKITQEEYEQQSDEIYHPDDWVGRSGIEKVFDHDLRGDDGGRQVEVNVRGRQVRVMSEKEPSAGSNITLTIDGRLQELASKIIGEQKGSMCLLDLEQGEVLALVSKPDFDPNVFVSPAHSPERVKLMSDSAEMPLLNRGVSAGFPPGSVFKLVTALAALESGKVTPSTVFICKGKFQLTPNSRPFKCWNDKGHQEMTLSPAIERSCNIYFYQAGMRAGAENLARVARELGLGQLMDIELTNISEGMIPDAEWKRKRFHDEWYQGETLNFAIGQGYVLTTPLQVARLVGTIGRDGEIPETHLVRNRPQRIRKPRHISIQPANIHFVKQAMELVVQSDHGTGQLARVDFLHIGAKTGTAQVPPHEPHSWFSGFFPFEQPRYALSVFIEHGGPGGYNAAKLAKQMIIGMKDLGYFEGVPYVESGVPQGKTV